MSQLARYLEKIDNQAPINLSAFKRALSSKNLHLYLNPPDIQATMISKGLYEVTLSSYLRAEIEKLVLSKEATRAEAASSFQSHSVKVNGSLIVAKYPEHHPGVIVIDAKGGFSSIITIKRNVLIVENRDTFLRIDTLLPLLNIPCKKEELLILLGNGNDIANTLHKKVLSSPSNIYYFLDIDLGGLQIARNVLKIVGSNASHIFLIPGKLRDKLRDMSIMGKLSVTEKNEITKIGKENNFLLDAVNILLHHQHKIEQEALIG